MLHRMGQLAAFVVLSRLKAHFFAYLFVGLFLAVVVYVFLPQSIKNFVYNSFTQNRGEIATIFFFNRLNLNISHHFYYY